MVFRRVIMRVGMAMVLCFAQMAALTARGDAEGAAPPQLLISQFKVTTNDGQFFTLYNAGTTPLDLSGYELEYFNNNDLTKATSSKILPLSGILAAKNYYMLSDGAAAICYQMTVDTVSLGFSTTSGFAEVLQLPQQSSAGTLVMPAVSDYVSWTKKTSGGNDTQTITSTGSSAVVPTSTSVTWLRQLPVPGPGASAWQPVRPDPTNACNLQVIAQSGGATTQTIVNPGNQLGTGQQPPATIISLATASTSDADTPVLPAADIGLAAPQITEMLPNPTGTGNDDTDEYIELYNPNPAPFDLSGFTLQTGTTTKHSYVFTDGTMLAPRSFTAFYSAGTGLSLSNTSGQTDLLDPFGNMLSQSDAYGTAKDGQTWALANGKWYWTTNATPNAANVIKQAVTTASKKTKAKTSATSGTSSSGAVKGAATTTNGSSLAGEAATPVAPVHPLVLAAVGIIAVGYGIYEYRHDIANKIHQLRRNRKLGRTARV